MWNKDPNSETLRDVQDKLDVDIIYLIVKNIREIFGFYSKENLTNGRVAKILATSITTLVCNQFQGFDAIKMLTVIVSHLLTNSEHIQEELKKSSSI